MRFSIWINTGVWLSILMRFEGWSGSKVLIPKSEISNKWHDIRVHAKWSTGADGIFQIWVNGILKLDREVLMPSITIRFGSALVSMHHKQIEQVLAGQLKWFIMMN